MAHVVDQSFSNEIVEMDGNTFERCQFHHCTFVFRGTAEFSLLSNNIDGGTWEFRDAASLTVAVLRLLYAGGFSSTIERTFDMIRGRPAGDTTNGPPISFDA